MTVISALPNLTPIQIVSKTTGELLTWDEFHEKALTPLLGWVLGDTQRLYDENTEQVLADAGELRGSANSYSRQKGYKPSHMELDRTIKARSRLGELVHHKLMSETASYVRNPNPKKQPHRFSRTVNLGAVNKQMVWLERDTQAKTLHLHWKCWDDEYELTFHTPHYLQTRQITKWSLPVVGVRGFVFTTQEEPTLVKGSGRAGLDLGRAQPFTLAILSEKGKLAAEYRAKPQVVATNRKRERILAEVKFTQAKAQAYESLGLDSTVLRSQTRSLKNKASRIGNALTGQIAANITQKLTKHQVSILQVENLTWAQGAKYGSRWNHGAITQKIEHTTARHGIHTKRVNPRNTSQTCHKCGSQITHNTKTRTVYCGGCKLKLDRDVNAAMNIAKRKNTPPTRQNRPSGNDSSPTGQVISGSLEPDNSC